MWLFIGLLHLQTVHAPDIVRNRRSLTWHSQLSIWAVFPNTSPQSIWAAPLDIIINPTTLLLNLELPLLALRYAPYCRTSEPQTAPRCKCSFQLKMPWCMQPCEGYFIATAVRTSINMLQAFRTQSTWQYVRPAYRPWNCCCGTDQLQHIEQWTAYIFQLLVKHASLVTFGI